MAKFRLLKREALARLLPEVAAEEGAQCTQFQVDAICGDLEAQAWLRIRETIRQNARFKRCRAYVDAREFI